jgi:hypothetical protein
MKHIAPATAASEQNLVSIARHYFTSGGSAKQIQAIR